MLGERKREIKLFCPSLSKMVPLVALDEQRLDLGSIARTFGLDLATLKLNGHFISRGIDLLASSVTWKSLISFFSARGLPAGTAGSDALVVDGKLCKVGTKRTHDSEIVENDIPSTSNQRYGSVNGKPQLEDSSILKKKRFRDTELPSENIIKFGTLSLKRKRNMEDVFSLKRIRENDTNLGAERRENGRVGTLLKTRFPCSFTGVCMKRTREDEMAVPVPCKKVR